ncbi:CBS domain-containing protein [Aliikangiella marina]|uniref:CBS domain-containing protein n=1 Tax=Aliikangiella marina TaxID=1712262 RepID=A0A545TIJ8_9GAMM|nr:CBS domain-containing protein [Aliikangiella marina]TQV77001.1 CBS domain-containing protein [Aliikangiella marina]
MLTVAEFMSPSPTTLTRFNSLADARKTMAENGFRHIPIVDEVDGLVGLVSQGNILAHGGTSQNYLEPEEQAKIESGTLLADIMVSQVTSVTENFNIADAARLIHQTKFGCLPVVDENNQVTGIITAHDFVSITLQLLDLMDQSEPIIDSL